MSPAFSLGHLDLFSCLFSESEQPQWGQKKGTVYNSFKHFFPCLLKTLNTHPLKQKDKKARCTFVLMPCSLAEVFNSRGNENYDMKHVALCKRIYFCSELDFSNPAWFECWSYQGLCAYFYPFIDESMLSRETYFTHSCQLHPCFITHLILCMTVLQLRWCKESLFQACFSLFCLCSSSQSSSCQDDAGPHQHTMQRLPTTAVNALLSCYVWTTSFESL